MNKKNIYIAGKLFKDGDIRQRKYEEEYLKKECKKTNKEINIYNPINNDDINKKGNGNKPIANDIYEGDKTKLLESEIVIGELDDEDPGTIWECGICNGINIIYDLIDKGYTMEQIKQMIPRKTLYLHCSDIRQDSKGYRGIYLPWGINQFVVGGAEQNGKIFRHFEEIAKAIASK